jgi:hypothetical protein
MNLVLVDRDQDQDERKLASEISKRQKRLEKIRKPFDDLYDDVDDYVIGRRANYDLGDKQGGATGAKAGSKIFDQTAAMALQDFVDGYQGNTAASTIDWWSPRFRSKQLMQMAGARKWLDDVCDAVTTEINNSGLYSVLSEATWDRATYGYSTVFGPEWSAKRNRLVYYLRHPREVFFSLNAEGDPDLWHRKFLISGRQVMDLWPNAPLKETFRTRMERDPYKEYTCIQSIFPREERDITKIDSVNKAYASVYTLDSEKVVLEESGMDADEVPTTARWRLTSEAYPRSVAIDTIFQVMLVNSMSRSVLKAAQLLVEPPMIQTGTIKGKVKIVPNGITTKESPNDLIEPIQFPSALQAGLSTIADTRAALGEMFKAKIFTMMSQMDSRLTATQAQAMQGEQATLLQPIVTRDQNENLEPIIRKTFKVLQKAGRIPPAPPSIRAFWQTPVDIAFSGPVAMLARRHLKMQGFDATVPKVIALAKEIPQLESMLDNLDPDKTYAYIMQTGGAPEELTRDEKVVAKIRDTRAKQLQEQQKQEALNKTADTMHKGSTAPEEGSPTQKLMEAKK